MYYEADGTPTEWNTCCKCGKSSQFDRFAVLTHWPADRKPEDPVDAYCREHFPSGATQFDIAALQAMSAVPPTRLILR